MRRMGGFTLVELLIALALTGLVALLLLSATQFATLGLGRVSDQAERLAARRNIEALLRREIAAAAPLAPNAPALVGAAQRVRFITLAEDGGAGLYRVELGLQNEGGSQALVLTRIMLGAPGAAQRTVLAPRLRDFRIAYFGALGGAAPRWQDAWDGSRVPPSLVRIALDTGDGLARPPLIVRLWTAPN